jgi:hypothetical protein
MKNYRRTYTKNSQNARRRGLCGLRPNKATGELKWHDHVSVTMERSAAGQPAAVMHSRAVIRAMRSKYVPHVGKKQLAKLALR